MSCAQFCAQRFRQLSRDQRSGIFLAQIRALGAAIVDDGLQQSREILRFNGATLSAGPDQPPASA
jgi:hypothetical protein